MQQAEAGRQMTYINDVQHDPAIHSFAAWKSSGRSRFLYKTASICIISRVWLERRECLFSECRHLQKGGFHL